MKFSAVIFFVLFLSGCEPFSYKFHIIVTEVPVNLGALNSAYDDWNSDLPFLTNGPRSGFPRTGTPLEEILT